MAAFFSSTSSQDTYFPVLVRTEYFHVTKPDTRGCNSMYNNFRNRSYLFELDADPEDTNHCSLILHTNDKKMDTSLFQYKSDCRFPNESYRVSLLLTHFFKSQKVIPRTFQNKVFSSIKAKLLRRINFIRSRLSSSSNRNNHTTTFFKFSYKRYRFHFGIFIACPKCSLSTPCARVFSGDRRGCCFHSPHYAMNVTSDNLHSSPPRPRDSKSDALARLYLSWTNNETKTVINNRLGISYKTRYKAFRARSADPKLRKWTYQKVLYDYKIVTEDFNGNAFSPTTLNHQASRRLIRARRIAKGCFSRSRGAMYQEFIRHRHLCEAVPHISFVPRHVQLRCLQNPLFSQYLPITARPNVPTMDTMVFPVNSGPRMDILASIRDMIFPGSSTITPINPKVSCLPPSASKPTVTLDNYSLLLDGVLSGLKDSRRTKFKYFFAHVPVYKIKDRSKRGNVLVTPVSTLLAPGS